jgi:hypothetical protein
VDDEYPPWEPKWLKQVLRCKEQVPERVAHAHHLARTERAAERGEVLEPEGRLVSDLLDDVGDRGEAGRK